MKIAAPFVNCSSIERLTRNIIGQFNQDVVANKFAEDPLSAQAMELFKAQHYEAGHDSNEIRKAIKSAIGARINKGGVVRGDLMLSDFIETPSRGTYMRKEPVAPVQQQVPVSGGEKNLERVTRLVNKKYPGRNVEIIIDETGVRVVDVLDTAKNIDEMLDKLI